MQEANPKNVKKARKQRNRENKIGWQGAVDYLNAIAELFESLNYANWSASLNSSICSLLIEGPGYGDVADYAFTLSVEVDAIHLDSMENIPSSDDEAGWVLPKYVRPNHNVRVVLPRKVFKNKSLKTVFLVSYSFSIAGSKP